MAERINGEAGRYTVRTGPDDTQEDVMDALGDAVETWQDGETTVRRLRGPLRIEGDFVVGRVIRED